MFQKGDFLRGKEVQPFPQKIHLMGEEGFERGR